MNLLLIQPLIPPLEGPGSLSLPPGPGSPFKCIQCPRLCHLASSFAAALVWSPELDSGLSERLFCSSSSSGAKQGRTADFAWFEGKIVINPWMSLRVGKILVIRPNSAPCAFSPWCVYKPARASLRLGAVLGGGWGGAGEGRRGGSC